MLCAAYPIFTNVDEPLHYDVVVKYGGGQWPLEPATIEPETAEVLWKHGSLAYMSPPEASGQEEPLAADRATRRTSETPEWVLGVRSHEVHQPPVYYTVAGGLFAVSRLAGLPLRLRPFLIRMLNVPWIVLTVIAGYRLASLLAPDRPAVVLGVPLALALVPQDAFCQVTNDSLSAAVCGWAMLLLLAIASVERHTWRLTACAGLITAAAILTKWTNVFLLVALGAAVGAAIRRGMRTRNLRDVAAGPALAVLALLPVAAWSWRCHRLLGDWTGSSQAFSVLGWAPLPLDRWFDHPLFSPSGWNLFQAKTGLGLFLFELTTTFWRGEFTWYSLPLHAPLLDVLYYAGTATCLAGCVIVAFRCDRRLRWALLLLSAVCLGAVLELAVLSIQFDFGACPNPSREHPYMSSGRLILGTLVPFVFVLALGADQLLRPIARRVDPLVVLTGLMLIVTVAETVVSWPAITGLGSLLRP